MTSVDQNIDSRLNNQDIIIIEKLCDEINELNCWLSKLLKLQKNPELFTSSIIKDSAIDIIATINQIREIIVEQELWLAELLKTQNNNLSKKMLRNRKRIQMLRMRNKANKIWLRDSNHPAFWRNTYSTKYLRRDSPDYSGYWLYMPIEARWKYFEPESEFEFL